MLKSMTGFGRCEIASEEKKIIVEMKAVNHRYCDMSIKLPKKLSFFEVAIRNVMKEYVVRGKVDIFITYEDFTKGKECVKYNEDIAREYYNNLEKIADNFQLKNQVTAQELSRYPDVFTIEEQEMNEDEVFKQLVEAVRKAAASFLEARMTEGEHLRTDILKKLAELERLVEQIENRTPSVVDEYRTRLTNKVFELLGDKKLDDSALASEIIIYADKICVDEETVRLKSHISNMRVTLDADESIGRKLDFIAQEMNREANTILSKASDLDISNLAIDLKTGIEKIREQIQNIE